jgi:hypothetical protein
MDNIMPWDIDVGIATWKILRHETLKPLLQLEKSCHETLKLSLWREKYLTSRDTEATIATWKILCHDFMSRDTEAAIATWKVLRH